MNTPKYVRADWAEEKIAQAYREGVAEQYAANVTAHMRAQEERDRLAALVGHIEANASAHHATSLARARALDVIAQWCRDGLPEALVSLPERAGVSE